eukprot:TRINITY_DN5554_c0_g2_i1.p1 TRINITY_DN5554_c0_g2~~TRINITY_DN5554_c0_g2_i1.p1  ORF type:complete len:677 (+),score=100.46 TRINITY_DN5554_c0_g2_i1:98-2128(+)
MLIYRLSGTLGGISCFGSALVILSFFSFKELRRFPGSLIITLCACDFFLSLKFVVTGIIQNSNGLQGPDTISCQIQAGWYQFFAISSVGWNAIISIVLISYVKNPFSNIGKHLKIFHAIVWATAISTTVFLLSHNKAVGPSGDGSCWVSDPHSLFRLLFFVPLVICFFWGLLAQCYVASHLQSITNPRENATQQSQTILIRMIMFNLVFIACWSFALVHRSFEWHFQTPETAENPNILALMDVAGVSIQGFATSLVWLTSPGLKAALSKRIPYLRRWRKPNDTNASQTVTLDDDYNADMDDANRREEGGGGDDCVQQGTDLDVLSGLLRRNIIRSLLIGICESAEGKTSMGVTSFKTLENKACRSGSSDFEFIDYEPGVFAQIRAAAGITPEDYIKSMNVNTFFQQNDNIKASGAKGGSFFCFSPDRKFIMKTIHPDEAVLLENILHALTSYFLQEPNTLISKFYGFHGVQVSQVGTICHIVVMANVFETNEKIHECYDLKGSTIDRQVGRLHDEHPSMLGLDLDLKRQLSMPSAFSSLYLTQVIKDSNFLCELGIMDYSLLIGFHFHHQNNRASGQCSDDAKVKPGFRWNAGVVSIDGVETYYMGIIDILQSWNFKKKMERFAKGLLGKSKSGISSVPPKPYSLRFQKSMCNLINSPPLLPLLILHGEVQQDTPV